MNDKLNLILLKKDHLCNCHEDRCLSWYFLTTTTNVRPKHWLILKLFCCFRFFRLILIAGAENSGSCCGLMSGDWDGYLIWPYYMRCGKYDMNIYDLSGNMAVYYRNALWDAFWFFDKERPPAKIEDIF